MRLFRRYRLIALAAALSACTQDAAVTTRSELRKTPGTDGEILTLIPKGSRVEARNCANGWCRVSWNGYAGYVLSKTLRAVDSRGIPTVADEQGEEDSQADPDGSR